MSSKRNLLGNYGVDAPTSFFVKRPNPTPGSMYYSAAKLYEPETYGAPPTVEPAVTGTRRMRSGYSVVVGTGILCVAVASSLLSAQRPASATPPAPATRTAPATAAPQAPAPVTSRAATTPVQDHNAVVKQYCVGCHNERSKAGGLVLETFDMAKVTDIAPAAERMIVKLQAGMMPPPGSRRPDEATLTRLVTALETRIDAHAAGAPQSRASARSPASTVPSTAARSRSC